MGRKKLQLADMSPSALSVLRRKLLSWFRRRKRDFPWRASTDPYRVLVSEIMLQQTTSQVVIPAYERFLAAFPTVENLALSREDDVLTAWAGLGYYRRARSLHRAAREIVRDGWPRSARELERLPGIGPYTAAAVASIAFGEAVPVLDGNVVRVMSRFGCISGDPLRAGVRTKLLSLAGEFVSARSPGDSNQALMELGATVCRLAQPSCGDCPLSEGCGALEHGAQDRYPTPRKRPAPVEERHAVFVVRDAEGRYLLEKKSGDGPLKGLWGFPVRGPLGKTGAATKSPIYAKPPNVARSSLVATVRHSIMNRRLMLEVYSATAAPPHRGARRKYLFPGEIEKLPRSSIVDKVLRKLSSPGLGTRNRSRRRGGTSAQRTLFDEKTPGRSDKTSRRRKR